jgi:hypothetical protein
MGRKVGTRAERRGPVRAGAVTDALAGGTSSTLGCLIRRFIPLPRFQTAGVARIGRWPAPQPGRTSLCPKAAVSGTPDETPLGRPERKRRRHRPSVVHRPVEAEARRGTVASLFRWVEWWGARGLSGPIGVRSSRLAARIGGWRSRRRALRRVRAVCWIGMTPGRRSAAASFDEVVARRLDGCALERWPGAVRGRAAALLVRGVEDVGQRVGDRGSGGGLGELGGAEGEGGIVAGVRAVGEQRVEPRVLAPDPEAEAGPLTHSHGTHARLATVKRM